MKLSKIIVDWGGGGGGGGLHVGKFAQPHLRNT